MWPSAIIFIYTDAAVSICADSIAAETAKLSANAENQFAWLDRKNNYFAIKHVASSGNSFNTSYVCNSFKVNQVPETILFTKKFWKCFMHIYKKKWRKKKEKQKTSFSICLISYLGANAGELGFCGLFIVWAVSNAKAAYIQQTNNVTTSFRRRWRRNDVARMCVETLNVYMTLIDDSDQPMCSIICTTKKRMPWLEQTGWHACAETYGFVWHGR